MAYSVWQAFITDGGESIVAAASVAVYRESDGALAAIFDGPAGVAIANPTTSGIDGLVRFYAAAGTYRIDVTKGGVTKTFRNIPIGDAAGRDVGVAGGVAPLDEVNQVPADHLSNYYTQAEMDTALALKLDAADYAQYYVGTYASLAALQAAHPAGSDGQYALVDAGAGASPRQYVWDVQAADWVAGSDAAPATTDALAEGGANLYFTAQRVRNVVLTGLSLATNAAISAADTVLAALGKLQAQVSDLVTRVTALESGGGGGGGLDDAGVAALIDDAATPSNTRTSLDAVIGAVAYSDAALGTAIADAFGLSHATILGNVISSPDAASYAAGLNAAVNKPGAGLVSLGEFRVDAGGDVAFMVANASGDGISYICNGGQWEKATITGGVPGASTPLALGFGTTASVLLSSAGAVALVVEGQLFSLDALFAADASVNTIFNLSGAACRVAYTTAGDKYSYDYTGLGLGTVTDVLARTIKPIGKLRPVAPVYPIIEPGSNPRNYTGFAQVGGLDIDTRIKFECFNTKITLLSYSGGNVATPLITVGAGAVVYIGSIDCGAADVSTVVAVENGGIVTVGAIIGTGAITDNFNQAPMVDTVDGFIRSSLTQAH